MRIVQQLAFGTVQWQEDEKICTTKFTACLKECSCFKLWDQHSKWQQPPTGKPTKAQLATPVHATYLQKCLDDLTRRCMQCTHTSAITKRRRGPRRSPACLTAQGRPKSPVPMFPFSKCIRVAAFLQDYSGGWPLVDTYTRANDEINGGILSCTNRIRLNWRWLRPFWPSRSRDFFKNDVGATNLINFYWQLWR